MILRKGFVVFTIIGLFLLAGAVPQTLAGFESPTSGDEKTVGPTMWGVGVIDCPQAPASGPCFATLRVKKIDDCVVSTDVVDEAALIVPALPNQPAGPGSALHMRFESGVFFGLPCESIITKVKNWEPETAGEKLYSFDAQIMFIVTDDSIACE